jgi:hypothetical protein
MKVKVLTVLFLLLVLGNNGSAQDNNYSEKHIYSDSHGNTLNLGLGIGGYSGYYGYEGGSVPAFHINYEFDVAKNFTLAPFATFLTYYQNNYRETIIPLGGKGTYYFDQILGANRDWDFYLAGSLGFTIVNTRWDDGYAPDSNYQTVNPLFLDLHMGAEYHLSRKIGLFLDLSTGVSTIGLAFH